MRKKQGYKHRKPQRRKIHWGRILLPIFLVAVLSLPFLTAGKITVEEHTLQVKSLPDNLRNLKIVFLSDIHRCGWFSSEKVEDLFLTVNNLSPDIVILGGDYATDGESALQFFRELPPLHARLGVYGVLSENDRDEDISLATLVKQMQDSGVTPLVNSVEKLRIGKNQMYIIGADPQAASQANMDQLASQVKADDFVVFVAHSPDTLTTMLRSRGADNDNHWFDLALFGKTHGGQVNLFGYTPFSALKNEDSSIQMSGWRDANRAAVLVSTGVGTSYLPARLFAPARIHFITLKAR